MTMDAGNNFTITLEQSPETGTFWQVRVYKKRLWFKKLISSDWFLDESQAKKFEEQLALSLSKNGLSTDALQRREPGWTLNRPSR
jgi:hypothetical protein